MSSRLRLPVLIIVAVGVVFAVVGVVYLVTPAADLPSWLPGHLPTRTLRNGHVIHPNAHIGRGIAMLIAAVGAFAAGWWLAFRYKPAAQTEPAPQTEPAA